MHKHLRSPPVLQMCIEDISGVSVLSLIGIGLFISGCFDGMKWTQNER